MTRREVEGDTLLDGRWYSLVRHALYETDGTLIGEQVHTLRFDTTSAQVLQFTLSGDVFYYLAPCPFDVPFESYVECYDGNLTFYAEGGYDGVLVFETGWEPDTLRGLSVKRYAHTLGAEFFSFVGGFGLVLYGGKGPDNYGLYYARIAGVEYGVPRYPTASEPSPEPFGEAALSVWPNPSRGAATVALVLPEAGEVDAALYDVLGRRVAVLASGRFPPGRHEVALDGAALPPGVYVVRATAGGAVAARTLTLLR